MHLHVPMKTGTTTTVPACVTMAQKIEMPRMCVKPRFDCLRHISGILVNSGPGFALQKNNMARTIHMRYL